MNYFIHICVNDCTRHTLMRQLWSFLRFYPGSCLNKERNRVKIENVMTHIFITQSQSMDQLQGIQIKGFDIEYGVTISERDQHLLHSLVR